MNTTLRITLFISIIFTVNFLSLTVSGNEKPRVFIFTDINIDAGDPDDRQSLVHLLWYTDVLQIEGIVPERWNAGGYEACKMVLEAYEDDYKKYAWQTRQFDSPDHIREIIAKDRDHASRLFKKASTKSKSPLYVLIWGNMKGIRDFLQSDPDIIDNLRILSIGTGLMNESNLAEVPDSGKKLPPCKHMNWNSPGRNDIYQDRKFDNLWWVEMNWTYEGMFSGSQPEEMLEKLSKFGSLGQHLKEVVRKEAWAQYFRVGDTPSVLYVIDSDHDLDDPSQSSWAGKFNKPFPSEKPHYFTDYCGDVPWNYMNPCETWENHARVRDIAAGTLESRREEMYNALLEKLNHIYGIK